jgi:hypothetical protein
MSGVFQLLGTLRNKLLRTLRHLRQQLRHSLRASEIRLRRTIRTDLLLRVPTPLVIGVTDGPRPVHDWTSHAADVFRYLALTLDRRATHSGFYRRIDYPQHGVV